MRTDRLNLHTAGAFHPGIVTAKFFETWDFYTECLGFTTVREDDDRVLLEHASGARLEILRHETHQRFSELVPETDGRGFWLNLEVEDVDDACQRLCAAGVLLVHPPENTSGGRRVFTVRDPNGVLICIGMALGSRRAEAPYAASVRAFS